MKLLLRLVGFKGFLLFTMMFFATFLSPIYFEKAAKNLIETQIEKSVLDKLDNLDHPSFKTAANFLSKQFQNDLTDLKQSLREKLPQKIAEVVTEMGNLSCECRKKLESDIRESVNWQISLLEKGQNNLISLIQGKYSDIVKKLLLDLRIFSCTNAVAFGFLIIVSFLNNRAIEQLFLPGGLLFVATFVCAYFYVFEQNWFFTILFNNYVGFGYISYLFVTFLFLCDILFNKAKITTEMINQILNAIGNDDLLSPC